MAGTFALSASKPDDGEVFDSAIHVYQIYTVYARTVIPFISNDIAHILFIQLNLLQSSSGFRSASTLKSQQMISRTVIDLETHIRLSAAPDKRCY